MEDVRLRVNVVADTTKAQIFKQITTRLNARGRRL